MSKKDIKIIKKEIHRVEYLIDVPSLNNEDVNNFLEKDLEGKDETERWILKMILGRSSITAKPFTVCFRRPEDLELNNKIFYRICDFNNAILGETLCPSEVIALCYTLNQLPESGDNLFIRQSFGSSLHILSTHEEAGKYCCVLDIVSLDDNRLTLNLRHQYRGGVGLYFNPTSYYGVKVR